MSTVGTITTAIAPSLLADVGWSRAAFALVGSLALVTSFAFPFVGRLADIMGVRWTALIGMVTLPLVYLAYSMMNGQLWVYITIFFIQSVLCVTTTATVYSRLVVQYVERSRGLALAIAVSGSAITGAIGAPILNAYVEANGWREAYQALAIFSVIASVITFLLIPAERQKTQAPRAKRRARDDYPLILRSKAFWILLAVMLLCNLPATIMLVQLKLLLMANGVGGKDTAVMLSALSVGMLAGRFVAGLALDRFRADIVSFVSLGLPSVGLFLIASSLDAPAVLTFAVFCLGFSFGAEGDIVGFLVARHFGVAIYSSVMGLLTFAISFSTASGAALLSFTMARTGGYELYLVIVGTAVLLGSSLLLLLGPSRAAPPAARA
ncbi:MFS transporter [Novosphingobium album (ex Liu et al. 2023)]|uniref:MFS transporter n=1 Tax=Novosphingobium album (ex Liu et al. 2023) TaxID=3031130 RepID=A0ABT5WJG6_9SPHN|nr:MFS transporter [Novosphingobium album (ex Liu et al. 2023)]MDE8650194.1 MFS transporter [Novosphingobium album (ex Liu et al. 2023)]